MNETAVIVDDLLEYAVSRNASDIHCDPNLSGLVVRLRVDGIMEYACIFPAVIHEELIARLKILSGARTDLRQVPQDGRWSTTISEEPYNVRVSFMPTYYGENAVMRLLSMRKADCVSFCKLGFTPEQVHLIARNLSATSGLILCTGPTGSGKTTTLHTCLWNKSREHISVITLEDPVEYLIPGVRQVHIRHENGVTFGSGLRSTLRQDPDVIMVGEIRDSETAKVAIHTALTGHLVFSTLHTNSAVEAITRLLDMGVDHYLLASTLRLIIGQRLVRKVCDACMSKQDNETMCDKCRNSGYFGRSLIAEVLDIDSGLSSLIENKAKSTDYLEHARKRGFMDMASIGKEKLEWKITTREEIERVLSE